MIAALACIPLLSAFAGWLTIRTTFYLLFHPQKPIRLGKVSLQGVYYKKEIILKSRIAALIKKELTQIDGLTALLGSAAGIEKLKPELEQHIDMFLRIKLKEAMPMIGMLIGDRTINQLKALFLQELETLFPSVMRSYVNQLKHDPAIDSLIADRLDSFTAGRVKDLLHEITSKDLVRLCWLAAAIGFIFGCLQLLIIIIIIR